MDLGAVVLREHRLARQLRVDFLEAHKENGVWRVEPTLLHKIRSYLQRQPAQGVIEPRLLQPHSLPPSDGRLAQACHAGDGTKTPRFDAQMPAQDQERQAGLGRLAWRMRSSGLSGGVAHIGFEQVHQRLGTLIERWNCEQQLARAAKAPTAQVSVDLGGKVRVGDIVLESGPYQGRIGTLEQGAQGGVGTDGLRQLPQCERRLAADQVGAAFEERIVAGPRRLWGNAPQAMT